MRDGQDELVVRTPRTVPAVYRRSVKRQEPFTDIQLQLHYGEVGHYAQFRHCRPQESSTVRAQRRVHPSSPILSAEYEALATKAKFFAFAWSREATDLVPRKVPCPTPAIDPYA